ncbi:CYTH domain-containing protein [Halosquirtibacter laminarini]|uniref:CYTH domain-containing protein n=1 Tax=Halosquirtibacter laminarini TaxID=3374600 RepID=A0AC61NLI4_9BACT|nr:CYTH domain-containing protein [Prolixibacteraceae bacterium]
MVIATFENIELDNIYNRSITMGKEIERKYIVSEDIDLDKYTFSIIEQGYLSTDPDKTVRIRVKDDHAFITIKGRNKGIEREEFEYKIPVLEAKQMLEMTPHKISKRRYYIQHHGHLWELDIFEGENSGLRMAEIELNSSNETFSTPPWAIEEVSEDPRYFNSQLCLHPFSKWE